MNKDNLMPNQPQPAWEAQLDDIIASATELPKETFVNNLKEFIITTIQKNTKPTKVSKRETWEEKIKDFEDMIDDGKGPDFLRYHPSIVPFFREVLATERVKWQAEVRRKVCSSCKEVL